MATNNATQADTSIFGRIFVRFTDEFYLLFRLIFAFLVSLHGAQKAFQMWGFPAPGGPAPDIVYVAGWIEFISALLIGFGVLTRLGAGALCVTMVVAYFMMHFPNGIAPHIFPAEGGFTASGGEGVDPLVRHRRHHRYHGQPEVRAGTLDPQEGNPVARPHNKINLTQTAPASSTTPGKE